MPQIHRQNDDPAQRTNSYGARRQAMAVIARANARDIKQGLDRVAADVAFVELRAPETGLVMLRGRIGSDGPPFNVGEATATRAVVALANGEKGFGYVLGRDHGKARLAALCDALFQSDQYRPLMEQHLLEPLRAAQARDEAKAREQTAATRVDFFTLVRGED